MAKQPPVLVELTRKEAEALRDSLLRNHHIGLANKFTAAINAAYPEKEPPPDEIFAGREAECGNIAGNEAHCIRNEYSGKGGDIRL